MFPLRVKCFPNFVLIIRFDKHYLYSEKNELKLTLRTSLMFIIEFARMFSHSKWMRLQKINLQKDKNEPYDNLSFENRTKKFSLFFYKIICTPEKIGIKRK